MGRCCSSRSRSWNISTRPTRTRRCFDEPTRLKWIHNWIVQALKALEANLAGSKETGRYCQGDAITIADICLVTQATGANFFKVDLSPFPTVRRIVDTCMQNDAFARAHPLRQPGAPASV